MVGAAEEKAEQGEKDQERVGGTEQVRWEQTPVLNEGSGQEAVWGKGAPSSGHR